MSVQAKVRGFHEAFDLVVRDEPQLDGIPRDEVRRVARLLCEEVAELFAAMFGRDNAEALADTFEDELLRFLREAPRNGSGVVEVARESADVLSIVYGNALNWGFDLDAAFDEVIAACMRKRGPDGKVRRRGDGKVLKPDGWQAPYVAAAIGLESHHGPAVDRVTTQNGRPSRPSIDERTGTPQRGSTQ